MQEKYKLFYQNMDITQYRSILVLDGDLPEKSFFELELPIIAADGALNKLHAMGIKAEVVIGDLDAVQSDLLHNIEVVHKPDQNSSDFQKALVYLEDRSLLPSIIVGINGGFLDHILNNVNIFLQKGNVFYAPSMMGHVIYAGETRSFSLPINTKISIMGFPQAEISSQGLKWELQHYPMDFPGKNSTFNRTKTDFISIEVHKGLGLVMIYCL